MANSVIYMGNPVFVSGTSTPFGFYDNDPQFAADAVKVTKFCASRLGYPTMDVEMDYDQFFLCFEEAVTTYGNEVYLYQIRNNYLNMEAASTGSNLNNVVIQPNNSNIIRMAQDYGSEVGVGGNVTYYSGTLTMTAGVQDYDMTLWASSSASLIPGDSIEIKQIFYEGRPASTKQFAGYQGVGVIGGMSGDGFLAGGALAGGSLDAYSMLMPLNMDLAVIQNIELREEIRRSANSFELINNQLKIFPIPTCDMNLFFKYVKSSEKNVVIPPSGSFGAGDGLVTDMSNVPYNNPVYSNINGPGRYWIFEYTLALAKEMLGLIRGKYQTTPIPGAEVSLNQQDLLSSALNERTALIEKLRADLDETSRKNQLLRKKEEVDSMHDIINYYPMLIFIG